MIGEQLRQYAVQKELGNGGMGSIYLALDTTLDRAVALKFILADFNQHPGMARRFLEEAKVLASLNSPNIPVLYEYFIWQDQGVMAMEYVDGETFESMVQRRGPIPAHVSVPLVKQALRGLAAAHRRGVVHRDLKPGNLMLNKEDTVKVVDFGIAKKIEVEARLTATNTTVGTPMYMAPEQVMGKPVDARTDIYSMGVVFYELLAGQVPFDANSVYEIHAAHVQKTPDPPTVHYPHIPRQVVDAVMRALQKDPAARFSSAEDFMRALPDLEQAPIPDRATILDATTITPDPLPQVTPAPHVPTFVPAPTTVHVAPTPVPVAPSREGPVPQPPVAPPPIPIPVTAPPASGQNKPLIAGLAACLVLIVGVAAWLVLKPSAEKPASVAMQPNIGHNAPQTLPNEESSSPPPAETTPPATPQPAPSKPEAKTKQKTSEPPSQPPKSGGDTSASTAPVHHETVAATPTDLSGQWEGFYFDTTSQQKTAVRMTIRERDGGYISGSVQFQTPDNTTGQCDLNGSSYQGGTLRLLFTHCAPRVPYFNTFTTFSGVQPTASFLSAGKVFNVANMVASLERH